MATPMYLKENQIDSWVRGHVESAQGTIAELVSRLIDATFAHPRFSRFHRADSINQPGPDGELIIDAPFDPYIPGGRSYWEIGTGHKPAEKATSDYDKLTSETPPEVRAVTTFVFVTPLSGQGKWPYTWKQGGQNRWLSSRRQLGQWADVRVIDGTQLVAWIGHWRAVERWLARQMEIPIDKVDTPDGRWEAVRGIGAPPKLLPDLFLANRDEACARLKDIVTGSSVQLKLETRYTRQAADFYAAFIAAMDDDSRKNVANRSLILSNPEAWESATLLRDPHILVADFDLDGDDGEYTRLLARAHDNHHGVVYYGHPGGIPEYHRAVLLNPKTHQVQSALEKSGHHPGRARDLSIRSEGNLTSLLRCMLNLSTMPEWTQRTHAADLAIAQLLGRWDDNTDGDRSEVEQLSGNVYGEWTDKLRQAMTEPNTPLILIDGLWRIVARYEAWYAAGPLLSNDRMIRFVEIAIRVLSYKEPKFELPEDDRFAAQVYGKYSMYSPVLRKGIAETLALLGGQPKALSMCSPGQSRAYADTAVRKILEGFDWVIVASLDGLLPLLAEASPTEFLASMERAFAAQPCPIDSIFAEESSAGFGQNYMTGVLWSLESLAWHPEYFARACQILAQLDERDPGGNWGNRPINSLTAVLLPVFPQTYAAPSNRISLVRSIVGERPIVGWRLLLRLLPPSYGLAAYTYAPTWRDMTQKTYSATSQSNLQEQTTAYAELALRIALGDAARLVELIGRYAGLPTSVGAKLMDHLLSPAVDRLPDSQRQQLWVALTAIREKDTDLPASGEPPGREVTDGIRKAIESLTPKSPLFLHKYLFGEDDYRLFNETLEFDKQVEELENRRVTAIKEIYDYGGIGSALEFAADSDTPWRVGFSFAAIASPQDERSFLPEMLSSDDISRSRFAAGYVARRFTLRGSQWLDSIKARSWMPQQVGQALAYMPFGPEVWELSSELLGADGREYWSRTQLNPYLAPADLAIGIKQLLSHNRPSAAIYCMEGLIHRDAPVDTGVAVAALNALSELPNDFERANTHAIVAVIKAVQAAPDASPDDLMRIEFNFLPLLDDYNGAFPTALEHRLASDPSMFCEIIQTIFKPRRQEHSNKAHSDEEKKRAHLLFTLLHKWRVPPGCSAGQEFGGDTMAEWLKTVKSVCAESDHYEIALSTVGQVFVHVPADPDGFWIHRAAAEALNANDADDLRTGYRIGLANSRGVHAVNAGRDDIELAIKYSNRGDEADSYGYHRLAACMRDLADSYQASGEREALRDQYNE